MLLEKPHFRALVAGLLTMLTALGACDRSRGGSRSRDAAAARGRGPKTGVAQEAKARPSAPLSYHLTEGGWSERTRLLTDRRRLRHELERAGYEPPPDALALAARIEPGLGGPALRWVGLGETGFVNSHGVFYAASTVKLVAAVGALLTLKKHGLSGATRLYFTPEGDDKPHSGSLNSLAWGAVRHSNNQSFDRMIMIAGFDAINRDHFSAKKGWPIMVMQTALSGKHLRYSPPISWIEGKGKGEGKGKAERKGMIHSRRGTYRHLDCPKKKLCVTLLGLLEVLRRVVLHDELPSAERFDVYPADLKTLRGYLLEHKSRLPPGPSEVLGEAVTIHNKIGWVPKHELIEVALITAPKSGERYLVGLGVPMPERAEKMKHTEARLARLGREVLKVVRAAARAGRLPPVQQDAGIKISVTLPPGAAKPSRARPQLAVTLPSSARSDRLECWLDHRRLTQVPAAHSGQTTLRLPHLSRGRHALVLRAYRARKLIGHRTVVVEARPAKQP